MKKILIAIFITIPLLITVNTKAQSIGDIQMFNSVWSGHGGTIDENTTLLEVSSERIPINPNVNYITLNLSDYPYSLYEGPNSNGLGTRIRLLDANRSELTRVFWESPDKMFSYVFTEGQTSIKYVQFVVTRSIPPNYSINQKMIWRNEMTSYFNEKFETNQSLITLVSNGFLLDQTILDDLLENAYNQGKDIGFDEGWQEGFDEGVYVGQLEEFEDAIDEWYEKGYYDGSNDSFQAKLGDWIVPAIIVVIILGGTITFLLRRRD